MIVKLILILKIVINEMFSFFNSFGASSNFEKHRLLLTSKNYEAPD